MDQTEIIAFVAQTALTYIFVSVATNNASQMTVKDQKQDLRTTKEDLMSEMKDTRESLLRESEVSTMAIIDIIKAELGKEIELLQAIKYDKKTKYGNTKRERDGLTFDSKKEYYRYCELKMLLQKGEISDLRTQVKFTLVPAQRETDIIGKRGGVTKGKVIEREVAYYADFVYKDKNGHTIVEDTKGYKTNEYIIKRKLLLYVHGIRIREL